MGRYGIGIFCGLAAIVHQNVDPQGLGYYFAKAHAAHILYITYASVKGC
jgi:hypothetical protein